MSVEYSTGLSPSDRKAARYLGIGCLGILALVAVGVALTATGLRRQAKEAAAPPTPASVQKRFTGIPLYPGARLDAEATRATSEAMKKIGGQMAAFLPGSASAAQMRFAIYRAPSSPAAVAAWYDAAMPRAGWKAPSNTPSGGFGEGESRLYQRGDAMLMLAATSGSAGTQFQLMYMP